MKYELDVLRVKKGSIGAPWAIRMTINGVSRYRLYHYKKEAIRGMVEWIDLNKWAIVREFNHNFDSAETLGIQEKQ